MIDELISFLKAVRDFYKIKNTKFNDIIYILKNGLNYTELEYKDLSKINVDLEKLKIAKDMSLFYDDLSSVEFNNMCKEVYLKKERDKKYENI